jgi:hypothetical protein
MGASSIQDTVLSLWYIFKKMDLTPVEDDVAPGTWKPVRSHQEGISADAR